MFGVVRYSNTLSSETAREEDCDVDPEAEDTEVLHTLFLTIGPFESGFSDNSQSSRILFVGGGTPFYTGWVILTICQCKFSSYTTKPLR